MVNTESRKHIHIARLAEMRLYFTGCMDKAQIGSKAWERYRGFIAALDAAIEEMSGTEALKE